MAKYSVPVIQEVSAFIEVVASSPEEALKKAKERWGKEGSECTSGRCSDVDFAYGEDLGEIEEEPSCEACTDFFNRFKHSPDGECSCPPCTGLCTCATSEEE